ncbi:MAG: 3-oxoacyl-[acyl-carrier-protein] synthase 3 [Pirellulaceae bacterium]|nr:MAG: 3-oxoacyl-[acyl-carrier-protein] synthase 3 [Pirellulaceae bacterium]
MASTTDNSAATPPENASSHSTTTTDSSTTRLDLKAQDDVPMRVATLTGVQILSTGGFAPREVVKNEDLEQLGYDADWIVQRTGIRQRRRAAADEATSDLAFQAAAECLDRAGLSGRDVDLILVATMTPDYPTPSTACLVQKKLAAGAAGALDVNAACAGFMYALVCGMQFVRTGCCRHVLVIGADVMTRTVDPEDRKTFPLFGDGAGAVLLGRGTEQQGLLAYTLGADGRGGDVLCTPAGGSREPITPEVLARRRHFLRMDGRAVFKWAVRTVHDAMQRVLDHARLTPHDIHLFVLHQANMRILDAALADWNLDRSRVYVNLDRYGNTSAASVPLVLAEADRDGLIRPGDRLLLAGFGAGLAWGAGVWQW